MPESFQNTLMLVERAQRDDDAARQELFDRYLPRVRRIAALRLGRTSRNLLDVDDITQEVMLTAFAKLNSFEVNTDARFCLWLAKIVENRIRMDVRAGKAIKRGEGKEVRQADLESAVHSSRVGSNEPTPSQHAIGNEANDAIERALLGMPDREREVVIQRSFCNLDYAEIATNCGLSSANVARATYSRALRELERRIAEQRS